MANRSQDEDRVLTLKTLGGGTTAGTGVSKKTGQGNASPAAAQTAANSGIAVKPVVVPTTTTPTAPTAPTTQTPTYSYGSSGGGGGSSNKAESAPLSAERNLIGALGNYDPAAYEAYTQALQALEAARGQLPTYNNTYGDQLDELYAQITGREPFKYDLDSDPLYQQYRDMYMMQGQQAMMNAMGQAAALTGGYSNTYSQAVGQQQYNAYLQDLNAIVPDLYQNAYGRWSDEGDRMLNQYGILGDLADREYGQYRDQMGDYWTQLDDAQRQAELEYNRGLAEWEREYQLNEDKRAQQADNYDRLLQLMQIGYSPNADEIGAAGMSEAEAAAWQKYFKSQTSRGGGGGGGTPQPTEAPAWEKAALELEKIFTTDDYVNPGVKTGGAAGDYRDGSMSYAEAQDYAKEILNTYNITDKEKEAILQSAMELWRG